MENKVFSNRTFRLMKFDFLRLKTRLLGRQNNIAPKFDNLHLGCGSRKLPNWINVDVVGADLNIDLASKRLPWKDNMFGKVVSQHVIEHLHLEEELFPLLKEMYRICKPGAEVYLTCPDMAKVCQAYAEDKGQKLLAGRYRRFPHFQLGMEGIPSQQIINDIFYQFGEHQNLFDFGLLSFLLKKAGFKKCEEISAEEFSKKLPEFPDRDDEEVTLFVRCYK